MIYYFILVYSAKTAKKPHEKHSKNTKVTHTVKLQE